MMVRTLSISKPLVTKYNLFLLHVCLFSDIHVVDWRLNRSAIDAKKDKERILNFQVKKENVDQNNVCGNNLSTPKIKIDPGNIICLKINL